MGHYDSCYEFDWEQAQRQADAKAEAYAQKKRAQIEAALDTLGANLETAGTLAVFGAAKYAKGYSDATLLKAFCEESAGEPYFPMGDTRPTAERLGWR